MDLIREISSTFSKKISSTKKNFIKFFTRKRPSSFRKDVKLFEELNIHYNSNSYKKLSYKGDPNYHAIRKRITKELINFLILENSENNLNLCQIMEFLLWQNILLILRSILKLGPY